MAALYVSFAGMKAGIRAADRDADRRASSSASCPGTSVGHDRLDQQPDLGDHAVDPDRRRRCSWWRLGVSGQSGVIAVLGVARVVCVAAAVAGELLQDFKVGYILGGTPATIQLVELVAVVVAALVMYFPAAHPLQGEHRPRRHGVRRPRAVRAAGSLMAFLAKGSSAATWRGRSSSSESSSG
jgi:hypothetical protein